MPSPQEELDAAVNDILSTVHPKKIILAGAGAGKTTTFKRLLEALGTGDKKKRLVATFLLGLKKDLEKDLHQLAQVVTFHGYCHALLRNDAAVRNATSFTEDLFYAPQLGQLIKSDWVILENRSAPAFLPGLRNLRDSPEVAFFLKRGQYYNAIGYDDSIVHVQRVLSEYPDRIPEYELIIIDEFQDFNRAEVEIINTLSGRSSVVVAGDDDQALYGSLRGASEDFIREFHARTDYKKCNLPFCMRCSSAVVGGANDIIAEAASRRLMGARIPKRYDAFPRPALDAAYPKVKIVRTSVQNERSNYFGRYVSEQIQTIPSEEIRESHEKDFPTVLLIGEKPYAGQVKKFLEERGYVVDTKAKSAVTPDDPYILDDGFAILKKTEDATLGWRIVLEVEKPPNYADWIRASIGSAPLSSVVDAQYREDVLGRVAVWEPEDVEEDGPSQPADATKPTVRLTSFQGSKGMSAQHVFILGAEDGRLPAKRTAIKSLEIRKFLVALTRTRKQCYVLYLNARHAKNGGMRMITPSVFIEWLKPERREFVSIDAAYWRLDR